MVCMMVRGVLMVLAVTAAAGVGRVVPDAATHNMRATLSMAKEGAAGGDLSRAPVRLRLRGGADKLPDLPSIADDATEEDKQDYAEAKQWVKRQMAELEERKKQRTLEFLAAEDGIELNTTKTRQGNVSIVGVGRVNITCMNVISFAG